MLVLFLVLMLFEVCHCNWPATLWWCHTIQLMFGVLPGASELILLQLRGDKSFFYFHESNKGLVQASCYGFMGWVQASHPGVSQAHNPNWNILQIICCSLVRLRQQRYLVTFWNIYLVKLCPFAMFNTWHKGVGFEPVSPMCRFCWSSTLNHKEPWH